MHDYQLEHLNTRSFEQLAQALALAIIGNQAMIFGDGPDGGREAAFEGPIKYPEGGPAWSGSGVMQAKFRQSPDSEPRKNADWAIAQLKEEFKKYKRRRSRGPKSGGRPCPDYYIFVTNVRLGAAANGGKDRVRETFEAFKKSYSLSDYAIWDGDQIRRYLDAQPAIRMTYAAWLLPGDVLTEMMSSLQFKRPEFALTIRRYLESELLDDQYAKLGQAGYTDSNAIPLSNVFVNPPVEVNSKRHLDKRSTHSEPKRSAVAPGTRKSERLTFLDVLFEEGSQVLRSSARPVSVLRVPLAPGGAVASEPVGRMVLVGGPGQGKTTVGQFACQLLRAALIKSCSGHSPEVAQALGRIEQQSEGLPPLTALRYPLRVDLKKLAEALDGKGDLACTSLLSYLASHIAKRTDSTLGTADFRLWLKSYPWLLVLDGLDEVPASSNRNKVMDSIRDFVSVEAQQQDADLMILATTRPQGYSEEFDPTFYLHITLAPLNGDEALRYGTRLAQARHPGLKTRVEELCSALRQATTNVATVRLMESPLQVTIMLALIEGGGLPPEQRWKLFHEYYSVIYRRETERGTPFSTVLSAYEPDIHWIHHRAGWLLQQRNATAGTTAARLTHSEFEAMVDDRLKRRGHEDTVKRNSLVKQIREAATDRLVLLVGNTNKEIGFEIRSLQEFMAAEHGFDGSEHCTLATVKITAPHPYWRNVFLFIAGRIFFEKETLIDSVVAACNRLNEAPESPTQGVVYAGSRLALDILSDGAVRNQPENARVLARCAALLLQGGNLEDTPDFLPLFRGEGSDVLIDELSKRLSSVPLCVLSWRICLALVCANHDWAEKAMKKHFPWRSREAAAFVSMAIDGDWVVPEQFWHLLKDVMYVHPLSMWGIAIWASGFRERVHSLLRLPPLRQIADISQSQSTNSEETALLDERGQITSNRMLRNSHVLAMWSDLKIDTTGVKDVHPDWLLLQAASEFARNPSASNLSKQFSLVHAQGGLRFSEHASYLRLPWQITAALNARNAGIDEQQIIADVASGAIGDTESWNKWDSIDRIRISSLGFPNGLMTADDEHLGAKFGNVIWRHNRGPVSRGLQFAEAFIGALPRLHADSPIVRRLAHMCCLGLNQGSERLARPHTDVLILLINECRERSVALPRDIVALVIRTSLTISERIKLLGSIGVRPALLSWLRHWDEFATEVNSECMQMFEAADDADIYRALVPLSYLPPLPFARRIPAKFFKSDSETDEPRRKAITILRTNQLIWDKENAAEMAAGILALRDTYPAYLRELVEFVDTMGERGTHLEKFFREILGSHSSHLECEFRARIVRLLVKLVERRPAIDVLPDPSVHS
jgi:hypothetical protein